MKIERKEITVCDLVNGYSDDGEGGVVGYDGKLDIRPPYQREFVYKDKQRDAVIDTVTKHYPLNIMYWAVRGDGTYEVIDGQQRTISIAQYVEGDFSFNEMYFHNLSKERKQQILYYELTVYLCEGTDDEKLAWFRIVNIAGEQLTDQELRNAVYAGSWVSDAKRYFSKSGGPAYGRGRDYLKGSPIRQDYLETAIKWISHDDIEDYMAIHQHEKSAIDLWEYYEEVIDWVEAKFKVKRGFMKGVDWGSLYNAYGKKKLSPSKIEAETSKLIADDDVISKSGIYPYILTRDEKYLNLRKFSDSIKQKVYEYQSGKCKECDRKFDIKDMEADHIDPWSKGGKTVEDNCQVLCKKCNRRKSSK
ncbi:MAG: hypothetical protein M2R45_02367 [Verrucomicrobia subdivision 3 bacterium]|nr:hypothetical protein [Limisphaerales bacterium]MCS1414918.1 hypothetical protein [Limisphaerales bacterium]